MKIDLRNTRQQMIHLMYIILLAFLSLNVDVDFIEAFADANKSIENNVKSYTTENEKLTQFIHNSYNKNPEAYTDIYHRIEKVNLVADEFVSKVEEIKARLLEMNGGYDDHGFPNRSFDTNAPEKVLLDTKEAEIIHDMLIELKIEFKKAMPAHEHEQIDLAFNTDETIKNSFGQELSWEEYHFFNVAHTSVLTVLSRLQLDVRMLQFAVTSRAKDEIEITFKAKVLESGGNSRLDLRVVNPQVVLTGQEIFAKLIITETEDMEDWDVEYILEREGRRVSDFEYETINGYVRFKVVQEGAYDMSAVATAINPGDDPIMRNFSFLAVDEVYEQPPQEIPNMEELVVREEDGIPLPTGDPFELTKFPVLYIGVENPLSIKYPELSKDQWKLSCTDATLTWQGDQYIINTHVPGNVTLNLLAKNDKGHWEKVASRTYNSQYLPAPTPVLKDRSSGVMSDKLFRMQTSLGLVSEIVSTSNVYNITGFEIRRIGADNSVVNSVNSGAYFSNDNLDVVRAANAGDVYIFDNINVRYLDGRTEQVSSIVIKII